MTFDDIKAKTYFLTKTNSSSFPIAQIVVEANNAYDRVASLIRRADARWKWDDENRTDLPIATTALVSRQQDYTLANSHLGISRVEILDQTGQWTALTPFDESDFPDQSLADLSLTTGVPGSFDVNGSSITLYPTPSYSQAASLKIYFTRGPVYFTADDTDKQPGFNALYHDLIPLWIAYNYAIGNGMANANQLMVEIQRKEDALQKDYAYRAPGRQRFYAKGGTAV